MLDRMFGPHRSVQRQLCIGLSALVIVLGLAIIPELGPSRGIPVAVLGLLTGVVLARMAENRVAAKASSELLGTVRDADEEGLRQMVERARTTSPARHPVAEPAGGDDGQDLPFTPERRRSS